MGWHTDEVILTPKFHVLYFCESFVTFLTDWENVVLTQAHQL